MAAHDSGEELAVKLKRRDDRMFYIRVVIDAVLGICGFLVIRNLNAMDGSIKDGQDEQKKQAVLIFALETKVATQAERIIDQEKMLVEYKTQQDRTETRLEAWLTKVSDKLQSVAEKVGAK